MRYFWRICAVIAALIAISGFRLWIEYGSPIGAALAGFGLGIIAVLAGWAGGDE